MGEVKVYGLCVFYIELTTMNVEYGQKVSSRCITDKVLHTLSWNVEDLSHLSDESSQLIVELQAIRTLADGDRETFIFQHASPCYENAL